MVTAQARRGRSGRAVTARFAMAGVRGCSLPAPAMAPLQYGDPGVERHVSNDWDKSAARREWDRAEKNTTPYI